MMKFFARPEYVALLVVEIIYVVILASAVIGDAWRWLRRGRR